MKEKTGIIKSTKMQKTATIAVSYFSTDRKYKKIIRKTRKIKADTNGIEVKEGDRVQIREGKPISKTKNWKVIKVLEIQTNPTEKSKKVKAKSK
jgi:small subunit ribosomal protein S17